MRKLWLFLATGAAVLFPAASFAQGVERSDFDYDLRSRVTFEFDKGFKCGVNLFVAEELRLKETLSEVDRFHTTVGVGYSPCRYFTVSAAYVLQNMHDSGKKWSANHRVRLDLTGKYSTGNWNLWLKERLQNTYKPGFRGLDDTPANELVLRSSFGFSHFFERSGLKPYFVVELRNTLNAPKPADVHNNDAPWEDYRFNDAYINRVRLHPGLVWEVSGHSALDFYLLIDYNREKGYGSSFRTDAAGGSGDVFAGNVVNIWREWSFIPAISYVISF